MPKTETPDELLTRAREHVAYMHKQGEEGIEDSPYGYEKAIEVIEGLEALVLAARKTLSDGLKYHEHDGHNMPKRVAREALEVLGVPWKEQG